MYRSLNVETLGITGRQSELIELALTYRFKGLDLDVEAFARQVESRGQEYATRCLDSANKCAGLKVGVWQLPVSWSAEEDRLKEQITKLPALANVAKTIGATRCVTTILPGSNSLTLKENFDFHSAKLSEIGELLAPHGISLGVGFKAAAKAGEDFEHQFVSTADTAVTLLEMVSASNVGLYLDTWNWHLGGGTIDAVTKLGVDKLVAVAVADVPEGATADSVELNQRLLPSMEGVIPHADLLNKLHDLEFDGPVTPLPHISQYKGVTRDKIVQRTADALRSVWPGADLLQEAEAEAAEAEAQGDGEAKKPGEAAKPDAESNAKTEPASA